MLNIAICDDISSDAYLIHEKLSQICCQRIAEYTIDVFTDPNLFLARSQTTFFHLVFLDIRMPIIDGFDAASQLLNHSPETKIVFLSTYHDAVYDAFPYMPLAFLRKECLDDDFTRQIGRILAEVESADAVIFLHMKNGLNMQVKLASITYIESRGNLIEIHMTHQKCLSVRKTFSSIHCELSDERFAQINKGLLVNLDHVSGVSGKELLMEDGEKLIVSQNHYKEFKLRFFRHYGEK